MEGVIILMAMVGMIVAVIVKNSKNKKNKTNTNHFVDLNEKDADVDEAMALFGFDTTSANAKEIQGYESDMSSSRSAVVNDADSTRISLSSKAEVIETSSVPQPQKQTHIYDSSNRAPGDLAHNYKPIEGTLKQHSHAIGSRIERDIPTETSIKGSFAVQGCKEHYDTRFVQEDVARDNKRDEAETLRNLRTAIVLGEVINKPAFKRRGGKIR